MIRLSTWANIDRKNSTPPQKTPKHNGLFMGFSVTFKVPTKADAGKPSCLWTHWTWKPSPRSISFDADENGQSRQVKSSQVNTIPKAKSKTRSKQNKDMRKCSSVYSER